MIDLEELKRLHAGGTKMPYKHWAIFMDKWADAFPAIVAKLEAAQRLRLCIKAWIESVPEYSQLAKNLEESLAAFDKEQQ